MATMTLKFLLLCLVAAVLTTAAAATSGGKGEAVIDEYGNVVTSDGSGVAPTISPDEKLTITITNQSPYRIDVYFDDGEYGSLISTLEEDDSTGINSFIGHTFFVTRHGM